MIGKHFELYNELVELIYEGASDWHYWHHFLVKLNRSLNARQCFLVFDSEALSKPFTVCSVHAKPTHEYSSLFHHLLEKVDINRKTPFHISAKEFNPIFKQAPEEPWFSKTDHLNFLAQQTRVSEVGKSYLFVDFDAPFKMEEKRYECSLIKLLSPHINRAIRLREKEHLGGYISNCMLKLIDQINVGIVFLDRNGTIQSANRYAQIMAKQKHGIALQEQRLVLTDSGPDKKLRAAIHSAISARPGSEETICFGLHDTTLGKYAFLNVVVRSLDTESETGPAVMVIINDPLLKQTRTQPFAWAQAYGFTRCESQLSSLLADGMTLEDAAEKLHVSINTVKTHLRGIYNKLGTNRQHQVVAILNSSSVRFQTESAIGM